MSPFEDERALPQVYLARHGETEWTLDGRHTGRTDLPLTARGEEQARRLGERLRGADFALVLMSPLRRARRTCELAGYGGTARVADELVEWDYGGYEGRRTAEIRRECGDWNLFLHGCPGGETLAAVCARAERVLDLLRGGGGDALLFSHRDFMRVLAARWLGLDAAQGRLFYLGTAALGILGYDHDASEPALRLWNDDRHLS